MKRLSVFLACMVAVSALAAAQTPPAVALLVQRGLEGNLDLARARQTLQTARDALPWATQLAGTRATVSGGYGVAVGEAGAANANAKVDVPIIPQVSVSASVSSQLSVGGDLSITPFAAGVTRYKETESYENAMADLAWQTASLGYQIESAVYGLVQAAGALEVAKQKYALKESALDIAQKSYELDGISWDDLEKARTDLTDSRQAMYDAQRGHLSTRVKLYQLVGLSGGEPVLGEVTVDELLTAVEARDAQIASTKDKPAVTQALAKARTALKALQAQLRATPTYRPSLSLGAGVSYGPTQRDPAVSVFSASGSINFSFSPNDIQTDARTGIQDSILTKQKEVELESLSATFQADVAAQALEVSRASLEGRTTSLRQARLTLQEAELLLEQGERTESEVADTRLAVRSAETALLAAAAGVLASQAEVLILRVL